eukprot:TRINITY_DN6817_c0_g1_i2.p1 TRINITY_DN6817_c0_g1~~TRINITY_DN6817_c0_g1_i2.p1  ORF type:complete len:473 (+),score=94.10 TRINITY_DN6817_c0_g1_i2:102-1520(+)
MSQYQPRSVTLPTELQIEQDHDFNTSEQLQFEQSLPPEVRYATAKNLRRPRKPPVKRVFETYHIKPRKRSSLVLWDDLQKTIATFRSSVSETTVIIEPENVEEGFPLESPSVEIKLNIEPQKSSKSRPKAKEQNKKNQKSAQTSMRKTKEKKASLQRKLSEKLLEMLSKRRHGNGKHKHDLSSSDPIIIHEKFRTVDDQSPISQFLKTEQPRSLSHTTHIDMNSEEQSKVFGRPLSSLSNSSDSIPMIVRSTVEFLIENGLDVVGLLRIPGCQEEVAHLRLLFDSGQEVSLNGKDPHDVAGVLKAFLREIPDPVVPPQWNAKVGALINAYQKLDAQEKVQSEQRLIKDLKTILNSLPKANYDLLRYLIDFLKRVVEREQKNLMNIDNLIKCIVPTVGCSPAFFYYPLIHYQFFFGDSVSQLSRPLPPVPDQQLLSDLILDDLLVENLLLAEKDGNLEEALLQLLEAENSTDE